MEGKIWLGAGDIKLRPLQEDDLDFVYKLWYDVDTSPFSDGPPYRPISLKRFKEWFSDEFLPKVDQSSAPGGNVYVIEYRGEKAGLCGFSIEWKRLSAEIWYEIVREMRGRGIGSKAVSILLDHIFREYPVRMVEADVYDYNKTSQKLLEKIGFETAGFDKYAAMKNGEYVSSTKYAISREKWARMGKNNR